VSGYNRGGYFVIVTSTLLRQQGEAALETSPASLIVSPWFDQLRVVLVRSRNPLNIGAAARAMSNFGIQKLRLVTPWEPSYLGARAAVGASEVLLNAPRCVAALRRLLPIAPSW
jgi:hypothetical protein